MATSQQTTFSMTRDQIIRSAFEDIGITNANEELEPEQIEVAQVAFNSMAKRFMAQGMHVWKRGRYTLNSASTPALVAGTYKYELTPTLGTGTEKPMEITECNRKDTSGGETPMTYLSLNKYENLNNKTDEGTPTNFYFERTRDTAYLYVWPAPDATFVANNSIEIIYEQQIQDMDVGNEDVDFPAEWYDALGLNLAYRLSRKYGTLDRDERRDLRNEARDTLNEMLDFDTESGSIYFQPDFY